MLAVRFAPGVPGGYGRQHETRLVGIGGHQPRPIVPHHRRAALEAARESGVDSAQFRRAWHMILVRHGKYPINTGYKAPNAADRGGFPPRENFALGLELSPPPPSHDRP